MNYRESKVYLEEISKYGSVLGLENMREMMKRLGNPQDRLRIIHISGTNGKGSVLAYISTVLSEQGYQVGRYISPTLFTYLERIQVDEREIREEDFARLLTKVKAVIEEMVAEGRTHPTIFEVETAVSFLYFLEQKCDFVVLETGLGGLEDATNIITSTVLEVITSISMDHMGFLGNTLIEIAKNKAGIIKPHTAVVTGIQPDEVMEVIQETCQREGCTLTKVVEDNISNVNYQILGQSFSYHLSEEKDREEYQRRSGEQDTQDIQISLLGTYQIKNAAIALEAFGQLKKLGYDISWDAIKQGMKKTKWNGRFTVLHHKPMVLIDGAHNEGAAKEFVKSIETYFPGRDIIYIMGVFADKEYEKMIQMTAPYAKKVITVQTPDNPRALPSEELAKVWRQYHKNVNSACCIDDAVEHTMAAAKEEEVIIAFGSLSFLGCVKSAVDRFENNRKDEDK